MGEGRATVGIVRLQSMLGTARPAVQERAPRCSREEARSRSPMMLDLEREARRAPPLFLDRDAIDPTSLAQATKNWRERMVSEHVSARVFASLLGSLMKAGFDASEQRRVAAMAQQELDHGLLCARVLVALGEAPLAEVPRLDDVPLHPDASPLEAVLRNVISIGCCSETIAVALVATEREQAGPAPIRDVLDAILRDEVKHARFGWRLVSRAARDLDANVRTSLGDYLHDVFDHQIDFHAPFLAMPCANANGIAVGAPHGRSSFVVFYETMTNVVVPGLEACGLPAREAWRSVTRARG